MALGKRVARSRLGRAALVWLYARFASFVFATTRWRIHGRDDAEALIRAGQPFICAFWHGRLMLAPHGWPRGTPIHVMISRHRDGENIARATRHLGVVPIRGSRTRGGVAAGRAALRVLEEGGYGGEQVTFYVTEGGSGMLDPVAMGTAIQADLEAVGMDVAIET